jgi:predicted TIM-barrel fold metal-dependent hydrolase
MSSEAQPIDSHAHAWQRWPYRPRVPDPASRAAGEALLFEMQRNNVAGAVVVGAAINSNRRNNNYLLALQRRWPGVIFAFPDHDSYWGLRSEASPARALESLIAMHPFRGVSLYLADDEDGSRLLDRERSAAFRLASGHRLVLSLGMRPQHASAVIRLAEKHPQLRVLCHHFAGVTSRRPAPLRDQLSAILPLQEIPNVYLKVSGFPYLSPEPWAFPYNEQADLVQAIYEAFGANRLCWGSNFPVIDGSITYRQSLETIRFHFPTANSDEGASIVGGTMRKLLSD